MTRSSWAAAVGAGVFAFALTPAAALAASPGNAAASLASPSAKQDRHSGSTVDRVVGVHTPAPAHPSRRPAARHAAARPAAQRHVVVLLPLGGSGYRQAGRVRVLQRRLAGLGFAPGPIDGRYGPLTTRAVERFQSARRMTVNGVVGALTLRALRTARRGRVPTSRSNSHPVPQTHPAPLAGSVLAKRQREHSPALPVTPVLLGLAALGLATISLIYRWYTSRRHSDRFVPSPETRNNRDEPARLGWQASLGVPLEAQTDTAEALAAYRRADQSGDPTGAFNLGVLVEERGELAEALAAYRRADQRGHGAAASNLGVLLEERGEPAEALAAYRRADQRGDPPGAFNLGVLLEEQGELAEAEAAYRRSDQPGDGELAKMARGALLELGGRIRDSKAAQTAGQVSA
jgi:TPR repeat protein